jgi:HK97 family phage major capsid protein
MAVTTDKSDAMIARIEGELEERNAFIQGVIGGAQDADRDLTSNESEMLTRAKERVGELQSQLETLSDSREVTLRARDRAAKLHRDMVVGRRQIDKGEVEYRSAGAFALDHWKAHNGHRDAADRLEIFNRAAAHQRTTDNPGIIPDPIVGEVINFIDAARPLVGAIGPRNMPSAIWHRPKVTGHTAVGPQGTAGAAADEKAELVSQKMTITRLTANAVTYGGYVNVSRQNIDFSTPDALDAVVNDLAAQYAIETEAVTAANIRTNATGNPATYPEAFTQDDVASAVWAATGTAYAATRGQGRLVLAVSPDRLAVFGPLFAPYGPQNAQGTGFSAGNFGAGVVGTISGIPVVMSSGLGAGEAFLINTSAIEVYEQRVGSLQVAEPSVLGVQVAYAGYFTPLMIEASGIVPITEAAGV